MGWSWTFYEIGIFTLSINIVSKKYGGLNLRKKILPPFDANIFLYICNKSSPSPHPSGSDVYAV